MAKEEIGKFGRVYRQFYHNPKAAIKWLKKVKSGECIAALHRDDIGDIDIVWGKVTDPVKHTGLGLSHIIDKHGKTIKQLGFEVEDFIPIVVQFGNFDKKRSDSNKKVFASKGFRFVVAIQSDTKQWLLTAFDITKKPK